MKDAVKVDEHKLTALHAAFVNGGDFYMFQKMLKLKSQSKQFSCMIMQMQIYSIMY